MSALPAKTDISALGDPDTLVLSATHRAAAYKIFAQSRATLSNGLVMGSSYCGRTSSGIGWCSCCASPEWSSWVENLPRHVSLVVGASVFESTNKRAGLIKNA
jgi:hypothetical protein